MVTERIVVVGAGAIGGVLAARLQQAGTDVVVVARGQHGEAIAADGLVVESPLGTDTIRLRVAADIEEISPRRGDVVVLAVKSHHTAGVLAQLAGAWPGPLPVVCVQNGIANEPTARRWTPDVIAACVMFPATHLEPGVVRAHWAGSTGVLDLGRFPRGVDELTHSLVATLRRASFSSDPNDDIMRWKHFKLVMNLGNAVEALCGPAARGGRVATLLEAEGRACLVAAGIDVVSPLEAARRVDIAGIVADDRDAGGSTWQSLARGQGVETAYLNGEVVVIGELHGVETPGNTVVLDRVLEAARIGEAPGAVSEDDLLAEIEAYRVRR